MDDTNHPNDATLDASLNRLEPVLFMRIGSRSKRRRAGRTVVVVIAAIASVGVGSVAGSVLFHPATTAPRVAAAPPAAAPSIRCHSTTGGVFATITLDAQKSAVNPSTVCAQVLLSTKEVQFGVQAGPSSSPPVACTGGSAAIDVFPRANGVAGATCRAHGMKLWVAAG